MKVLNKAIDLEKHRITSNRSLCCCKSLKALDIVLAGSNRILADIVVKALFIC